MAAGAAGTPNATPAASWGIPSTTAPCAALASRPFIYSNPLAPAQGWCARSWGHWPNPHSNGQIAAYAAALAALIAAEAAAGFAGAAVSDCSAFAARAATRAAGAAARAAVVSAVVAASTGAVWRMSRAAGPLGDVSVAELLAPAPILPSAPRAPPVQVAAATAAAQPLWHAALRELERSGPLLASVPPPPQGQFSCVIAGQAPCPSGASESARRRLNAASLRLRERLAAAEARILAGKSRSGLSFRVTGSPARHAGAWAAMGASQTVLRHLCGGVTVDRTEPVHRDPPGTCGLNHPGATMDHSEWTQQSIDESLVLGVVEALLPGHAPAIVNPLDVVPKSGFDPNDPELRNKLRLICDGRKGNVSALEKPFKMETLHQARPMFKRGHWVLSYDLSSGYNHFEVDESERPPLGFQWGFWPPGTAPAPGATVPPRADGLIPRYYRYAGLPFGCRTAPYAFTQFMLVLVRYLRRLGISVLGYIDDFAVVCGTYAEGVQLDRFMRHTFASLGLVLNFKKSSPAPTQRACVLGIDVDLVAHTFAIPDKRKASISATAKALLHEAMLGRTVSVRDVASLTGKVMSCHIVLGDMAHLFTRSLFRVIAVATGLPPDDAKNYRRLRALWRTRCRLTTAAQTEVAFWLTHIGDARPAPIAPLPASAALFSGAPVLFQDASDHAFGAAWLLGGPPVGPDTPGVGAIARDLLTAEQSGESSTLRELHGVLGTLAAFEAGLRGKARVFFFTDSDCCHRALTRGSPTAAIHALAMRVHAWAMVRGLELRCLWMRRNNGPIRLCDMWSKHTALHDYRLDSAVFDTVEMAWGPHDVDVMASELSGAVTRLTTRRFFSRVWCAGTSGVDCFARSWAGVGRFFCHPPWAVIGRAIAHARDSRGRGTFLVPCDEGALWWPLVVPSAEGFVAWWHMPAALGQMTLGGIPLLPRFDLLFVAMDFS